MLQTTKKLNLDGRRRYTIDEMQTVPGVYVCTSECYSDWRIVTITSMTGESSEYDVTFAYDVKSGNLFTIDREMFDGDCFVRLDDVKIIFDIVEMQR